MIQLYLVQSKSLLRILIMLLWKLPHLRKNPFREIFYDIIPNFVWNENFVQKFKWVNFLRFDKKLCKNV